MRDDSIHIVGVEGGDEPHGPKPPPIGAVLVAVLAGIGLVWVFTNSGAVGVDLAAATSSSVATSTGNVPVTTITVPLTSTTSVVAPSVTGVFQGGELHGEIALTVGVDFGPRTVWVLRPGGSVVFRDDMTSFAPLIGAYPLLMTDGHIVFATGYNGYLLDTDLMNPHESFGPASYAIPGAKQGSAWFAGRQGGANYVEWVAPVDVGSRTVGERVDVTDVFLWPIAGVADGLVVNPIDEETYGRFAYWSPTDGIAPLSLRDPEEESVVAASGDLLVVASSDRVSIVDTANGDYLNSYTFDFGEKVTTACLAPDQRHIFVVGSNGRAYLGNTISGELFADYPPIQALHGVGWTSDDQLVYLAVSEMGRSLVVQDLNPLGSDRHEIALLSGIKKWWLAASGTMC